MGNFSYLEYFEDDQSLAIHSRLEPENSVYLDRRLKFVKDVKPSKSTIDSTCSLSFLFGNEQFRAVGKEDGTVVILQSD